LRDQSHRLQKRLVRITTAWNAKQVTWHEEIAQSVYYGHRSEADFSIMYRANKRSPKFAVNLNSQLCSCQRNGKVCKITMPQWTGSLLNWHASNMEPTIVSKI